MIGGRLTHVFVPLVPALIEADTLYVCVPYATAVHRCPGCERKVVTPFAPGSWNLIFDGETVSIRPSIRNAAHECRSHYFIERDRFVRAWDEHEPSDWPGPGPSTQRAPAEGILQRMRSWFGRRISDRLRP